MSKITAFIPARGGSKGIANKNIKIFSGKPLIMHTIEYALNSHKIDEVVVSTDDEKISAVAKSAGIKVIKRPANLSTDTALTESAIKHFIQSIDNKPNIIVLLQATSPVRPIGALDNAIEYFVKEKFDSLLSICPNHNFFWNINKDGKINANYNYLNRPRRQDMKINDKQFLENGSIYIFTHEHFIKTGNRLGGNIGFVEWPEEYSIEIDTLLDFIIAEQIYNNLNS